jgi:hypothetical protein
MRLLGRIARGQADRGPARRSAARRAFSSNFSITQCDAVYQRSPMRPPTRCGMTSLEVAVGRGARRCCEQAARPRLARSRLTWRPPFSGELRSVAGSRAGAPMRAAEPVNLNEAPAGGFY